MIDYKDLGKNKKGERKTVTLEDSQLSYLATRGKNYDKKYYMFSHLINCLSDIHTVVELFGGVGLESKYLREKYDIRKHIICEQDDECFKCLKYWFDNTNVNLYNQDSFTFCYDDDIDLLIIDSTFTKKNYSIVVDLIKKFKATYIILTNTGVFNVKFNKNLSYEEYWTNLSEQMAKDGLYLLIADYYTDFGLMLLTTDEKNKKDEISLNYITRDCADLKWRELRKELINV